MYHKISALLRFGRYVENITSITDVHLNYCAGSGPSTRCSSQVLTRNKRWPPVEWLNGADTLPLSLDKTITPMFELQISQDLHVSELCKYLGRCIKCVLTLRLVWDHTRCRCSPVSAFVQTNCHALLRVMSLVTRASNEGPHEGS